MRSTIKTYIAPIRKIVYHASGKKPWSYGYNDVRWDLIAGSIRNQQLLDQFNSNTIPSEYGIGFDERVVEYPWIFSKLRNLKGKKLLDAGSTLNFDTFIEHDQIKNKDLTILTYYPEDNQYLHKRVSYNFNDLREMPYHDDLFDGIICQSTIEHVDMDNSIYGYDISKIQDTAEKSYEYEKVISELIRILKPGGSLLLTFPYGRFENHGFFQQFDSEMVNKILLQLNTNGKSDMQFILYSTQGWQFATAEACKESQSFNPHTGKGKGSDGAAHCRCVCCIEFIKSI